MHLQIEMVFRARPFCTRPVEPVSGARHRFDAKAGGQGCFDHPFARVADAGTSGIGDEGDFLTTLQSLDDFLASPGFIELEITEQRPGDSKMTQQLAGAPRVFRGDDVAFLQRPQRAQRDIFEIPDGRGHEVKGARPERGRRFFHRPI